MTEQQAQALGARLTQVWVVRDSSSVPMCVVEDAGFRFCCELSPGVLLTVLGAVNPGGTAGAVGQVRAALLEGPRCELSYSEGKLRKFLPASAEPEEWKQIQFFVTQWTPLFRRGCFLSELSLQHSAREKEEWLFFFHNQGDTMKRFDFESRRIAQAFGVKRYDVELSLNWAHGRGHVGSCYVAWRLGAPDGALIDLACGDEEDRWFGFQHPSGWQWQASDSEN